VLEPEENAQMQLQYTPRDIISFTSTSTAPCTIERFTVTVTNITPDLVQVVAERFPRLTHLSFVWYPETDVAHGGVEITDASQILVSLSLGSLCFLLYHNRPSFPVCAVSPPSASVLCLCYLPALTLIHFDIIDSNPTFRFRLCSLLSINSRNISPRSSLSTILCGLSILHRWHFPSQRT